MCTSTYTRFDLNFDNTMFEVQKTLLSLSRSWFFVRHIKFKMAAFFYPGLKLSKVIFHKYGHVIYHWITNLMLI